jgi:hypothetical protein
MPTLRNGKDLSANRSKLLAQYRNAPNHRVWAESVGQLTLRPR